LAENNISWTKLKTEKTIRKFKIGSDLTTIQRGQF